MGAASSGYNYGANKNSPGNGNGKWQGLWPSVGHARNARFINIEAGGDNRNVVFCINQLGGVGKISNMFATTADGVKQPCPGTIVNKSWWFNNPDILAAWRTLQQAYNNNKVKVVFIGDHENLKTDHVIPASQGSTDVEWTFKPLDTSQVPNKNIADAINLLNSMKLQFLVNEKNQTHVVGLVGKKAYEALNNKNYGFEFLLGDNTTAYSFGGGQTSGHICARCENRDGRGDAKNQFCGACEYRSPGQQTNGSYCYFYGKAWTDGNKNYIKCTTKRNSDLLEWLGL